MLVLTEANSSSNNGNTGGEGAHTEPVCAEWQVVPINWQGVPIEEIS